MPGESQTASVVERFLRRRGVTPLVRASHSQAEVALLPPYGDPEVSIPGEVATYLALGATAVELLDRARD